MTSIFLATALAASTGIFGGKHCGAPKVHHARGHVARCGTYSAAPVASPCGGSMMGYAAPAPAYGSPQGMAPAAPMAPPKAMPTPTPSSMPPTPPPVAGS